jgi:hypothetical protein
MKLICILAVFCCTLPAVAQTAPIKVKIEGNLSNQERLLRDLNARGAKFKMIFTLADSGYDYRIAFETTKTPRQLVTGANGNVSGQTVEYPTGNAVVYNDRDQEIFRLSHEAFWGEGSAISGTAKEIVHRLNKWRTEHPK